MPYEKISLGGDLPTSKPPVGAAARPSKYKLESEKEAKEAKEAKEKKEPEAAAKEKEKLQSKSQKSCTWETFRLPRPPIGDDRGNRSDAETTDEETGREAPKERAAKDKDKDKTEEEPMRWRIDELHAPDTREGKEQWTYSEIEDDWWAKVNDDYNSEGTLWLFKEWQYFRRERSQAFREGQKIKGRARSAERDRTSSDSRQYRYYSSTQQANVPVETPPRGSKVQEFADLVNSRGHGGHHQSNQETDDDQGSHRRSRSKNNRSRTRNSHGDAECLKAERSADKIKILKLKEEEEEHLKALDEEDRRNIEKGKIRQQKERAQMRKRDKAHPNQDERNYFAKNTCFRPMRDGAGCACGNACSRPRVHSHACNCKNFPDEISWPLSLRGRY